MTERIYTSPEWAAARDAALLRDGSRCTVQRLIGGRCHPTLDVHHLEPVAEGGAEFDLDNLVTVCHSHHPRLEALRRYLLRKPEWRRCRHDHRYDYARRECERRLNRERVPA